MDTVSLSRRELLAGGLATGLTAAAGCLDLGGVTGRDAAETVLGLSLRRVDAPLRDGYVYTLDDHTDSWDDQALDAALTDTEYTTQHRNPFFASPDDPAYVLHDGTYYQLGSVIVDEVVETHPVLRLVEAAEATDTAVDGSDEGDLPEADQRAVQIAQMAARARGNDGGVPWGLVQRGGYVYRSEPARTGSELLTKDGPEHVTFRGTTYAVEITSEQFPEAVYRPTADPVTEDAEQMEAILKATFVGPRLSTADLSSAAQQLITDARTEAYSEPHPFSDAYTELLQALNKRAYIDGNIQKDAGVHANQREMIQYDNAYYESGLRFTDPPDS